MEVSKLTTPSRRRKREGSAGGVMWRWLLVADGGDWNTTTDGPVHTRHPSVMAQRFSMRWFLISCQPTSRYTTTTKNTTGSQEKTKNMTLTSNFHERPGCRRARVIGTEKNNRRDDGMALWKCGDIIQPQIDYSLLFALTTYYRVENK